MEEIGCYSAYGKQCQSWECEGVKGLRKGHIFESPWSDYYIVRDYHSFLAASSFGRFVRRLVYAGYIPLVVSPNVMIWLLSVRNNWRARVQEESQASYTSQEKLCSMGRCVQITYSRVPGNRVKVFSSQVNLFVVCHARIKCNLLQRRNTPTELNREREAMISRISLREGKAPVAPDIRFGAISKHTRSRVRFIRSPWRQPRNISWSSTTLVA